MCYSFISKVKYKVFTQHLVHLVVLDFYLRALKSAFLKFAAQVFEAGDFLTFSEIFLRFLGFGGSFSNKNFYQENVYFTF